MKTTSLAGLTAVLGLTALAQPIIIQLRYGPLAPQIAGVEYSTDNAAPIFVEFPDQTTPDGIISETVSLNVIGTVAITWGNLASNRTYALYSTADLTNAWVRNSPWLISTNPLVCPTLSWTQSFCEGQRFFKIIERE